jgi:hypothetical protein
MADPEMVRALIEGMSGMFERRPTPAHYSDACRWGRRRPCVRRPTRAITRWAGELDRAAQLGGAQVIGRATRAEDPFDQRVRIPRSGDRPSCRPGRAELFYALAAVGVTYAAGPASGVPASTPALFLVVRWTASSAAVARRRMCCMSNSTEARAASGGQAATRRAT